MAEPTKPSTLPRFADGAYAQVEEPTEAKKNVGWTAEKPPHQILNWIHKFTYQWIAWAEEKIDKMFGGNSDTTLTVSSGVIVPTHGNHKINNEGSASQDRIDTIDITEMDEGRLLLLRPSSDDQVTILTHNSGGDGSIVLKDRGDTTMFGTYNSILLKRIGNYWYEVTKTFGPKYLIGRAPLVTNLNNAFNIPQRSWIGKQITGAGSQQFSKGCFDGQDSIWIPDNTYINRINVYTGAVTQIDLSVGGYASYYVAVFDGSHIWTHNYTGKRAIKISRVTNAVVATVDLSSMSVYPYGMCFDGELIWVVANGGDLASIDPKTDTLGTIYNLGILPQCYTIGYDGTYLYIGQTNDIKKYNKSGVLQATIPTNIGTTRTTKDMQFDGIFLWALAATGGGGGGYQKIDVSADTIVASNYLGDIYQGAFDGTYLWGIRRDAAELFKIDIELATVIATITTPWAINGDGCVFDGSHVWGANQASGVLERYIAR